MSKENDAHGVQVLLPGALASVAGGERKVVLDRSPGTLADLLDSLAVTHPLLIRRVRDETGALRRFVNIYVDGIDVRAEHGLDTPIADDAVVQVVPSVAGG